MHGLIESFTNVGMIGSPGSIACTLAQTASPDGHADEGNVGDDGICRHAKAADGQSLGRRSGSALGVGVTCRL